MAEFINFDYQKIAQLEQDFKKVLKELGDIQQKANTWGNMIDQFYKGEEGDTLAAGIKGPFSKNLGTLIQKYQEVIGDLGKSMTEMQQADASTRKY